MLESPLGGGPGSRTFGCHAANHGSQPWMAAATIIPIEIHNAAPTIASAKLRLPTISSHRS